MLTDLLSVDLTMQDGKPDGPVEAEAALIQLEGEQDAIPVSDPELGVRRARPSVFTVPSTGDETELSTRPNSAVEPRAGTLSRLFGSRNSTPSSAALSPRLEALVASYTSSATAQSVREEIAKASSEARDNGHADGTPVILRAYKRAGWWSQFAILSERSFRNLYRNPMLMLSHYTVSVVVAGEYFLAIAVGSY